MPNSAARLIEGTAGVRIVLMRGGGGRLVSGPLLGLRARSLVMGTRSCEVEGRRNLSGLAPDGADGVLAGGSTASLGRGKVSERFGMPRRSGPKSSCPSEGDPNPPYPFFLLEPALKLSTLLLRLDAAVPGRSFDASLDPSRPRVDVARDGRRPASKGPGAMVFIRSRRFGACFLGTFVGYRESSNPSSPSAPYPDRPDCAGGGESLAICGVK